MSEKKRIIYDRKKLEMLSIGLVSMKYPEWPDDRKVAVGRSEEYVRQVYMDHLIADLTKKLIEEHHGHSTKAECYDEAKEILRDVHPKLIQNVNEWIDDVPISDIKIHNVSILDIINYFGDGKQQVCFSRA